MKKYILFIFLPFLVFGCKNNNCEDIACFTPPPNFMFELVDKTTGVNLFSNETLDSSTIKILDENSKKTSFNFISENDLNLISLSEIGWNLDLKTYTVTVESDVEFSITLKMEEKHENCCTFFKILQFNISKYEYKQSNTSEIYTIKID